MLTQDLYKKISYGIYFLLLLVILGYHFKINSLSKTNENLVNDKIELLGFKKNSVQKVNKVVEDLKKENEELKNKLKDPEVIEKIKYVVKTKYETFTVQVTLDEIPPYFLLKDSNEIPVCEFEYRDEIKFTTLPTTYDITSVILEDHNYTYLIITDYENKEHKIELGKEKLQSEVIKVKPKEKIFKPSLTAGINLNISNKVSVAPVLNLNLISYKKHSFLSPSYIFTENALGLELYSYNIGGEKKLIKNTNVGVTIHKNTNTYYGTSLTVKF